MPIVLVVAEQQPDGNLRKASLNALAAGKQLAQKAGAELHAVVLAKDSSKLAEELRGYGPSVVHAATAPLFEHYVAEAFAPAVAELARSVNARLVRRGDPKRWEYVETFTVNGHEGHATAREGYIEGHHSAWGDSGSFYSSRDGRVPIQE